MMWVRFEGIIFGGEVRFLMNALRFFLRGHDVSTI